MFTCSACGYEYGQTVASIAADNVAIRAERDALREACEANRKFQSHFHDCIECKMGWRCRRGGSLRIAAAIFTNDALDACAGEGEG